MRRALTRYTFVISILLLTGVGAAAHFYRKSEDRRMQEFDVLRFRQTGFTDEELTLFCDIAFNREGERVRKWETDIRVQIDNIPELNDKAVAEVDSVISILRPLIAPLKIERVSVDANLFIHRNVRTAPANILHRKPVFPNGIARINEASEHSWSITFAHIYDTHLAGTQTLMHEFEHILGLEHPMMLYDYYLTIGRSSIPQYYSAYGGWLRFQAVAYYISEQEKSVIRMLYSPEIKPGLKRNEFMKRVGMKSIQSMDR